MLLQEMVIPLQLRGRGFLWDSTGRVEQSGPRSCFLLCPPTQSFYEAKHKTKILHLVKIAVVVARTQQRESHSHPGTKSTSEMYI